jgi:hypothetical protein
MFSIKGWCDDTLQYYLPKLSLPPSPSLSPSLSLLDYCLTFLPLHFRNKISMSLHNIHTFTIEVNCTMLCNTRRATLDRTKVSQMEERASMEKMQRIYLRLVVMNTNLQLQLSTEFFWTPWRLRHSDQLMQKLDFRRRTQTWSTNNKCKIVQNWLFVVRDGWTRHEIGPTSVITGWAGVVLDPNQTAAGWTPKLWFEGKLTKLR